MTDFHQDFEYTTEEVVQAQRYNFLHSFRLKLLVLIFAVLIVSMIVQIGRLSTADQAAWSMPLVLVGILAFFIALNYLAIIPFAVSLNKAWKNTYTLRIANGHPSLFLKGGKRGLELDRVVRLQTAPGSYLVYFSSPYRMRDDFVVIPRRLFKSQEQEDAFRTRLEGRKHET